MEKTVAAAIKLTIGRKVYDLPSIQAAQTLFAKARDKSGLGCSQMPHAILCEASGKPFGYISYNGRAWAGLPTDSGDKKPISDFDNSAMTAREVA